MGQAVCDVKPGGCIVTGGCETAKDKSGMQKRADKLKRVIIAGDGFTVIGTPEEERPEIANEGDYYIFVPRPQNRQGGR